MKTYIAYFDILGFKEFIENRAKEEADHYIGHIYRESQTAVSNGELIEIGPGVAGADLSKAKVNCMHFSDSIIFWSQDASTDNFLEMVEVCLSFYQTCLQASFPVRGCMVLGDVEFRPLQMPGQNGATFYNSSLYGKGFVDAYLKGENQDWAGCYVDQRAIESVEQEHIYKLIYDNKLVYYSVPLKDGTSSYEHAFRIVSGKLNNVAFRNRAKTIESRFTQHMNGKPLPAQVQKKLNNTIRFLEYFRMEDEQERKDEDVRVEAKPEKDKSK